MKRLLEGKATVNHQDKVKTSYALIVTCVGRSKAPPIPLLLLLYEVYGMANIEHSIKKLLNDDVILVLAHPVMESQLWKIHNKTHNACLEVNT